MSPTVWAVTIALSFYPAMALVVMCLEYLDDRAARAQVRQQRRDRAAAAEREKRSEELRGIAARADKLRAEAESAQAVAAKAYQEASKATADAWADLARAWANKSAVAPGRRLALEEALREVGLPRSPGAQEVRARKRFLFRAYHPDRFPPGPERAWAEERFKRANACFQEIEKVIR